MELRHRVRQAASLSFGRNKVDEVSFWLCEGLKKRNVRGLRSESLFTLLCEWEMQHAADPSIEIHFLNESTGLLIPRGDEIGKYVHDKDVVRICSSDELETLLEKFSTRDAGMDADMVESSKPHTPLSAAISKLKRIGAANPTLKLLQKTFEDMHSPHDEEADLLERFPEIDPVFETGEVVELEGETVKCDMCDVSWPDDTATGRMYCHKKLGIITHHGCTQFAADVLASHPEITSRTTFLGAANSSQLNRPGTFHVTVHRAMELPGVQLLGTQAPYAKLSLLPWKEPIATKSAENGGKNPLWKSMHDNMMTFSHMYNSTITPIPLLEVEIWNSNYLADDLIACTLLDMTPLLRYPTIEAKRWFTLSSRMPALLGGPNSNSGANNSSRASRVLLSIKFMPLEGKYTSGNEHKFRVHQFKSIGLVIPTCAACDRVIVNVLKGVWGYRCEFCRIDVHKACIMKAITKCECKRTCRDTTQSLINESSTDGDQNHYDAKEKQPILVKHAGLTFTVLNPEVVHAIGKLYVNFEGLHLCSKQCQQHDLGGVLHAKNIFEGDTYCRLTIENDVYETSPVLKSADPMYMEHVCFRVRSRHAVFKVEVIDFNTDTCIAEIKTTLFQLLQKEADKLVHNFPIAKLYRSNEDKIRGETEQTTIQSTLHQKRTRMNSNTGGKDLVMQNCSVGQMKLYSPATEKKNKKYLGYALLTLDYVESKRDLLRVRLDDECVCKRPEDLEVSVESLKSTMDRLSRAIKIFQWIDTEYADILAWKNKHKSAISLIFFVWACLYMDLEFIGAYVMYGVLLFMLYQLHVRVSGAFERRWIGYMDYNQAQADRLKLHRPIADLLVAVHHAQLSESTERQLMMSQALLKDAGAIQSKVGSFYVRIKYLPNDQKNHRTQLSLTSKVASNNPSDHVTPVDGNGKDTVFVPSPFDQTTVGWTHAVEKSRMPVWRRLFATSTSTTCSYGSNNNPPSVSSSSQSGNTLLAQFTKQKKEYPYRNFNVSWRHNPSICDCDQCQSWRLVSAADESGVHVACGIDHHALYFPIPQAMRKNFSGREDVVPWKMFPGLLQFDLCFSLSGEAKETPDMIVATGAVVLRNFRTKDNEPSKYEVTVTMTPTFTPGESTVSISPRSTSSMEDQLFVRVELRTPDCVREVVDAEGGQIRCRASKNLNTVRRAERIHSEYVCESLVEKERTAVIGQHLFDALSKVKDTIKTLQNDIGNACDCIARVENLFNWTHPWKSAVLFAGVAIAATILSLIPGRWLVLMFGLSEFGAVFFEDLPPSNQVRHILSNVLSSLPTDENLIDVYDPERETYQQRKQCERIQELQETLLLRHHALWAGIVSSKGDNERSYKSFFMVYRPYRFVLWKTTEEAEAGTHPHVQLLFERTESIVHSHKMDEKSFIFHVFGTTTNGCDEKRSFSFETAESKDELLAIVHKSCEIGNNDRYGF